MNYILVSLFAYFLNCIAVLVDKFLLKKQFQNPFVYIFYISLLSLFALLAFPFTHIPTLYVFILASTSTLFWTTGAYFLYSALSYGAASRVVPVIGAGIPLLLFFYSLLTESIVFAEAIAICLLIIGLIAMTLPDWRGSMTRKEMIFEVLACFFFAASYIVLRQAYQFESFLPVLVSSRVILVPLAIILLFFPGIRRIVFAKKENDYRGPSYILFLFGQLAGGASGLLITFAISLANPALVNALQGVQYFFIFVASIVLARRFPDVFYERFTVKILLTKILGVVCIATGLYFLALVEL